MHNMEHFIIENTYPSLKRLQCLAERITGIEKMPLGLQTLVDVNDLRTGMLDELSQQVRYLDKQVGPCLIHQYLQQVSHVSDQVHSYAVLIKKHVPEKRLFLQHITEALTGTIKDIVTQWPSCNYLQLKVPGAFLYKKMANLRPRWKTVHQQLILFVQNDTLLKVATAMVKKCRPDKNNRITWQRFLYTEDLLINLEGLLRKNYSEQRFDDMLVDLLVTMDYNEKDFLQYYTRHIEACVSSTSNYYDKKNLLNWYFDKLEKLPNRVIPFTPLHAKPLHREYLPLKGRLLQQLTTYTSAINLKQRLMEREMQQLIWKKN